AVIIKKAFAQTAREDLPSMVNYRTHIDKESLFNTPPSVPVYVIGLVMEWIMDNGGLEGIAAVNRKKADLLYGAMDNSSGFYKPHVTDKESRSFMNVTFRLPSEELEAKFVSEGASKGLMGLKGHRDVGGCRASTYNAVSYESVEALVDFMNDFRAKN
ncbi:MAG TPA: aminotransferase class V-fold PLP-dependent enzyme, partial [Candidatus Sabulitectum sp.]|nr:aminotransferase class V-fold PLP-dependent enzyme [Candidatus Sabulitectum sp.]